jgi:hypothetical protein
MGKKRKMAARVCVRLIDSDSDVGTNLPAAAFYFLLAIDFQLIGAASTLKGSSSSSSAARVRTSAAVFFWPALVRKKDEQHSPRGHGCRGRNNNSAP